MDYYPGKIFEKIRQFTDEHSALGWMDKWIHYSPLKSLKDVDKDLANTGRTAAVVAAVNVLLRKSGEPYQLSPKAIRCLVNVTHNNQLWSILEGPFKKENKFEVYDKVIDAATDEYKKKNSETGVKQNKFAQDLLKELDDCRAGSGFGDWEAVWKHINHSAAFFGDLNRLLDEGERFNEKQVEELLMTVEKFLGMAKCMMCLERELKRWKRT